MIIAIIVTIIAFFIAQFIFKGKNSDNSTLIKPNGNILIFDTETNGFPQNWNASLTDTENWPEIVSIAWYKIAPSGETLSQNYYIIKPGGFFISESSTNIHGISNEDAFSNGKSLNKVLNEFNTEASNCKYLVAHNIEFDYAVVYAEFIRENIGTENLSSLKQICTMKSSTNFCKIQSSRGFKYPKLPELYQKLFSTPLVVTHNAKDDAESCMKCFKELYNKKIIKF